jgi:hypothetical protein
VREFHPSAVITGLVPVIQLFVGATWIAGTSPAMTTGAKLDCASEKERPPEGGLSFRFEI